MKTLLRKLFSPLLHIFEYSEEPYAYKPMNRKILVAMGIMFGGIAVIAITYILRNEAYGYFLPALVFSAVSLTCLIVGWLGNERAVAKIWGNK
jgi:hypothetical protein